MAGDDESFLARWSRRKREAETTAPEPAEPTSAPEASDHPPASEPPAIADIVAKLPPIEEITAATDIRAFLAPGVPTELRLAALRRAWSADPAIRDFIGLAENQWDFNAPDGVPGFGSLVDPEQVRKLLAKVVGGDTWEAPTASGQDAAPPDTQTVAQIAPVREELNASDVATEPAVVGAEAEEQPETVDVSPRRHGGALPKYNSPRLYEY
jgi:Protein of unknown function (DUF3306)